VKPSTPHDLDSFLKKRTETQSTYFTGTKYEFEALKVFGELNFDIKRTGKALDGGIDFKGEWLLPDGFKVEIIGQCKKEQKPTSAKTIRELEGSLAHQKPQTLGVCVSHGGYSIDACKHFMKGELPMAISVIDERLRLIQFGLNPSATRILPKLILGHKYVKEESEEMTKVVVLMYDGTQLGK